MEITPPKIRSVYIPVVNKDLVLADTNVEIKLDDKYYDVGKVKKSQIMISQLVPDELKDTVKTNYAYKVDYFINLPGLILPPFMKGQIVTSDGVKKLRIAPLDNAPLPYPNQTSPYTVMEPMRIADFMDLQYKAAEGLTEMNRAVNELLNDKMIADLTQSVANFKQLTMQATTTLEKAEALIVSSKNDLDALIWMMTDATNNFNKLATNINGIVSDEKFKPAMYETADAIANLSKQLAPVIGAINSKEFAEDLNSIMSNLSDISTAVNQMTKDEKLKKQITDSIDNLNSTMCEVSKTLEAVNGKGEQENIKQIVNDTKDTVKNRFSSESGMNEAIPPSRIYIFLK